MYDDGTSNGVPYMKVLALASNYEPLGVISWVRAVTLIYSNKVTTLEEYEHEIRSPSISIKAPAVVLFKNSYVGKRVKNSIRFSRKNVWIRDEGKCQYCQKNVTLSSFTIDHVIPKTACGQTTWDNVVACCFSCNQKKGNKSLKDSGYFLNKNPKKPIRLPYMQEVTDGSFNPEKGIPETWKFYLER